MEEKNTDDWFRVHVEDHVRMVEERRRLREQVTALQAASTKQCLEIRELREQWRREKFDVVRGTQRDVDVVWACVHKMLDDAGAPKESSAAARIDALGDRLREARGVKDLDARLNEALVVLDALVKSHATAAQAESKQRAIELLNKEHGR